MFAHRLSCFALPPPTAFSSRAHARRPHNPPLLFSASVSDLSSVSPGRAPRIWRPRPATCVPVGRGGNNGRGRGGGGGGGRGGGDGGESGGDSSSNNSHNLFRALIALYGSSLNARPLLTKSLTAALIALSSDATAQHMQGQRWSPWRAVPFCLASVAVTVPLYHAAFAYLEGVIPATCARNVVAQVVIDQVVCAPVWIVLFTAATVVLNAGFEAVRARHSPFEAHVAAPPAPAGVVSSLANTTAVRLRREFWPLLKLNWYMYPLIQGFNIALVPLQWRVPVMNATDLLFTVGLSMITHNHPHATAPDSVTASASVDK